jgi:hypothetical protein
MVLLEGTDRVGKSTVAQAMKSLLPNWGYRHHGVPPYDPFLYFGWFLADARPNTIVDRLHWSEYAYGKTYRNSAGIDEDHYRILDLMLLSQDTTVIYLEDSLEAIKARWDPKEPFAFEKFGELKEHFEVKLYDSVQKKMRCNAKELVEFPSGKPTNLLRTLCSNFEVKQSFISELYAPSVGLGSYEAQFVIIGEGQDFDNCSYQPVMPLQVGFASEWLWKSLKHENIRWWKGYYTNAFSFKDSETLDSYLENQLFHAEKILCLGNVARDLVFGTKFWRKHPGACLVVNHPNHARRFQHREFDNWSNQIGTFLEDWRF